MSIFLNICNQINAAIADDKRLSKNVQNPNFWTVLYVWPVWFMHWIT